MHVKFIARGTGSAKAAADYLLGERDAAGQPREGVEVRRGDPDVVAAVADSLEFEHKYTSGVIAWAIPTWSPPSPTRWSSSTSTPPASSRGRRRTVRPPRRSRPCSTSSSRRPGPGSSRTGYRRSPALLRLDSPLLPPACGFRRSADASLLLLAPAVFPHVFPYFCAARAPSGLVPAACRWFRYRRVTFRQRRAGIRPSRIPSSTLTGLAIALRVPNPVLACGSCGSLRSAAPGTPGRGPRSARLRSSAGRSSLAPSGSRPGRSSAVSAAAS